MTGADLAFFQGGGGLDHFFFLPILRAAKRRADFFGDFTSREAASRFFLLFYEPRSGEPIFFGYFTSREAASRFFLLFYEPRSGEPIFFGYFEPP